MTERSWPVRASRMPRKLPSERIEQQLNAARKGSGMTPTEADAVVRSVTYFDGRARYRPNAAEWTLWVLDPDRAAGMPFYWALEAVTHHYAVSSDLLTPQRLDAEWLTLRDIADTLCG